MNSSMAQQFPQLEAVSFCLALPLGVVRQPVERLHPATETLTHGFTLGIAGNSTSSALNPHTSLLDSYPSTS